MHQKLQQPHVHSNSPRRKALGAWFGRKRRDDEAEPIKPLTMGEITLLTRAHPHYPLIAGQGRAAP